MTAEPNLCPVMTLNHYLEHTKEWRKDLEGEQQLLLSTLKPHKPVSKSTISRWVKEVLKLSGSAVTYYQAHSTRSAASSKAKAECLRIEDILQKGNWSKESTWQTHYHREITPTTGEFQERVLSSKSKTL